MPASTRCTDGRYMGSYTSGKGVSIPHTRSGGDSRRRKHRRVRVATISAPKPPGGTGQQVDPLTSLLVGTLQGESVTQSHMFASHYRLYSYHSEITLMCHTVTHFSLTGDGCLMADQQPAGLIDRGLHRLHVPRLEGAQVNHLGGELGRRVRRSFSYSVIHTPRTRCHLVGRPGRPAPEPKPAE